MGDETQLQKGHRQRLKARWRSSGPTGFNDRDLLEFLLSYAIPRKDTKAIAVDLLQQFGSIPNVLRQSVDRLALCDGIGDHAATLLSLVGAMDVKASTKTLKGTVVKGPADVSDYLLREFGPSPEEKVILLILDQSNRILDAPLLEEGIENRANVYIKKAVRVVLDQGGTGVILVHNHPSGQPEFSRQDVQLTSALAKAFKPLEIRLLDHFLIAMDQVVSMKDEGIGFD